MLQIPSFLFYPQPDPENLLRPSLRAEGLILGLCLLGAAPVTSALAQAPAPRAPSVRWWHAAVALGGFAGLTLLDDAIQTEVQEARSSGGDEVARWARHFGQAEVYLPAAAGVVAAGWISGNDGVRDAGLRITASLATVGVMVTGFKQVAGRSRPLEPGSDADDFAPFSGHTSAPSGHTAMAFALATAVSDEIRKPAVTVLLYTAATATAWSRVNDNAHWTSDVAAGALIGIVGARFASGRLRIFGIRSPVVVPSAAGVQLTWGGDF